MNSIDNTVGGSNPGNSNVITPAELCDKIVSPDLVRVKEEDISEMDTVEDQAGELYNKDVDVKHLDSMNTGVTLEVNNKDVILGNDSVVKEDIFESSNNADVNGQREGQDENDVEKSDHVENVSEYIENGKSDHQTLKVAEENQHTGYRLATNIHDSDSDSSSISSDDSSSELSSDDGVDEDEDVVMPNIAKKDQEDIRTKGELGLSDLPLIEDLHITVSEDIPMWELGEISSIVGTLAIVQAKKDTPALDEDTILFKEDRTPLGQVFETFGPVMSPYYSVRFNSTEDIEEKNITCGLKVFFVPTVEEWTHFVFLTQLQKLKGSDASWENNNEPPDKFKEFSDDEDERRFKAKNRMKKTTPGSEEVAEDGIKSKRKTKLHKQRGKQASDNTRMTQDQPNRFNQWPPPGPPPFGPGHEERMGLPPMGNGPIRPPLGSNQGPGGFPRACPYWPGPRPFNNPWSEQGYHNRPRGPPPRPVMNRNQQHGNYPPVSQGPPLRGPYGSASSGPPPGHPASNHQPTPGSSQANSSAFVMMDMRFVQNKTGHSGTSTPGSNAKGPSPAADNSNNASSTTATCFGQGPTGQFRPPFRGPCPPQHQGLPPPMGPGPQGSRRPLCPIPPDETERGPMDPNPPWNAPPGPPPGCFQGPSLPRFPRGPPPFGARQPNFHRFQSPQFGGRPNFPQGPEHNWNCNN